MKLTWILSLIPAVAMAGECVMQSRTASHSQAQILERDAVVQTIAPAVNGHQQCVVSFRARIGNQWLTAHGVQRFDTTQSPAAACHMAMMRAEAEVKTRTAPSLVATDSLLVCSDQPRHQNIAVAQIGTVGTISQFRPNPDRPNEFSHNGTKCRWFVDNEFRAHMVHQIQGIVCHVRDQNWIVVDKF